VVVAVGLTVADPLNAGVPVPTAGLKLTLVAFVLDQANVALAPLVIVAGLAVSVTVGFAGVEAVTVTVAEPVALPPVPVAFTV
jgi:hypothetical protein